MQATSKLDLDYTTPAWQAICSIDDLIFNMGVTARIHEHQVAIFRIKQGIYALDNLDPFSQAAVLARGLVGDIKGRMVVASPMYKQHFCLQTGQCIEDPAVSVRSWPLRLDRDGIIYASLPQSIEEE